MVAAEAAAENGSEGEVAAGAAVTGKDEEAATGGVPVRPYAARRLALCCEVKRARKRLLPCTVTNWTQMG